jgi:hypothetical protein
MIKFALGVVVGLCIAAGAFGTYVMTVGNMIEAKAVSAASSTASAAAPAIREQVLKQVKP